MIRFLRLSVVLALLTFPVVGVTACANNRAPILVAQTGVALSGSIGKISEAGKQLQQASVLPAAAALHLQEGLLKANTALKPLPDILRTIDAAQQAGQVVEGDVEKAIAILVAVAPDISTLLAGVPVTDGTTALIDLVRAAQTTTTTVLLELAKLRQQ